MRVRKPLAALVMALMIMLNPLLVSATPQILFTTNGAAKQYAPGAVLLVKGWVGENTAGLSGIPALVVVENGSNTIYTSQVNTDSDGFFITNFNLGAGDQPGNTIKISVHAANTIKEDSVNVVSQSNPFQFLGGSIPLSSTPGALTAQAVPTAIDLVFNSNVNFFNNKNWLAAGSPDTSSFLGLNERNEDCIALYENGTDNRVSCSVIVDDNDSDYGEYYPLNSTSQTDQDTVDNKLVNNKDVLRLEPSASLSKGTTYRIEIDQELSANSSASLGTTQNVYFQTEAEVVISPTDPADEEPDDPVDDDPVIIPPSPGISADDAGDVSSTDEQEVVTIVNENVKSALEEEAALVIDLSTLGVLDSKERVVNIPAETIALAQQQNKNIYLKDNGFIIAISPKALDSSQIFTISIRQVDGSNLPAPPDNLIGSTIYEFNAGQNGQTGHHSFSKNVVISFPVPPGVSNPERLCVYLLNETTGQWEYAGGRIIDGRLAFTTNHFSKYMVAESTKTFADIAVHWAKTPIEVMVARQVITGVGSDEFAPDRKITRAEFATLLAKTLKQEKDLTDSGFSDISQEDWFAGYVSRAAKIGLVSGFDGKFNPNDPITRQEMAVMVMRAYDFAGGKLDNAEELTFADKANVGSWAADSVKGAYKLGIIKGRGEGLFAPLENATRAEAAVMLKSLMGITE